MIVRGISTLMSEAPLLWMAVVCLCTLITDLNAGSNRPLIPAPSTKGWQSGAEAPDYWY